MLTCVDQNCTMAMDARCLWAEINDNYNNNIKNKNENNIVIIKN